MIGPRGRIKPGNIGFTVTLAVLYRTTVLAVR